MKDSFLRFGLALIACAFLPLAPAAADEGPRPTRVGAFLDLEWRAMGLAEHLSHGPAFAAGVSLLSDHLRIGLSGFGRPGPWNPHSFDVTLPEGQAYKGQERLSLRSDGGGIGLHLATFWRLGQSPLALSVFANALYGGFGFYLQGEDRQTPDGRRVSDWENELFGGKDSSIGLMLEGGVRLHWLVEGAAWLRPYVALLYSAVPGFDTVVRDSYAGVSAALGVEFHYGQEP